MGAIAREGQEVPSANEVVTTELLEKKVVARMNGLRREKTSWGGGFRMGKDAVNVGGKAKDLFS